VTAPSTAETFLTRLIDARLEAALDARGIGNHRCVPTEAAYDAAVAALNKHRERADALADLVDVTATQAERATRHAAGEPGLMFVLTTVAERLRAAHERDRIARQSLPAEAVGLLREPLDPKVENLWLAGVTCPVCHEPPGTWCRSIGGNPVGWIHDERRDAYEAAQRTPEVILDPLWIEIAADHIGERITDWPRHMLTAAARDALMRVLPLIVARATERPAPTAPPADEPPFETIEMRAENGIFTRVEVLGENVAATGNGMAVLSPWAAEVVGNGYLHAARTALANAGGPPPTISKGGAPMPPIPAPPAVPGACSRCGGLEGNHVFRDCPGRNS
jgi:hypothetical protein